MPDPAAAAPGPAVPGEPGEPAGPVLGRRAALAALLAAGTGLTGCARIPTSGPVVTRSDVALQQGRIIAKPPLAGSTPAEIVDGFLRAAAVGSDLSTARAYLADPDDDWKPEASVVLHVSREITVVSGPGAQPAGPPTTVARAVAATSTATATPATPPRPDDGDRAEVVVELAGIVAVLDGDGRMKLLPRPEDGRTGFGLVARGGQWRIDELEDGFAMTLSQFVTGRAYRAAPLYFPDPTGRWFVPDVRYVRSGSAASTTQVVTAILQGPAPWLADAVTTPRPAPGLRVQSVPVSASGVATVDLAEAALSLDQATVRLLSSQVFQSLRGLGTPVETVQLTVDNQRLGVAGAASSGSTGAQPDLAATALAGGTFVGVDAKARVVVGRRDGIAPRVVERLQLAGGARPAMSYTAASRTYALLVTGKNPAVRTLKVAEGVAPPLDVVAAADLTPPSFDSSGWVWTSRRAPTGSVVAGILLGGRVRVVEVSAPWLTSGQVVSLRLSREGARALLVVDEVARDGRRTSRLLLCGVQRLPTGEPVALGPPVRLVPDLARACDAGWLDDVRVAVLGSRQRADRRLLVQPWLADVGGDVSEAGLMGTTDLGSILVGADGKQVTTTTAWERLGPELAPSLAVGDGLDAVHVANARGDLFHYRPNGSWERLQLSVFRPAFPG